MTTRILPAPDGEASTQYSLPELERRKILAQSGTAAVYAEIERQRNEFIKLYGNPWGAE